MDSYDASASLDLIRTSAHTPIDYGEDTILSRFHPKKSSSISRVGRRKR
jgi:hypothetical protein